MPNTQIGVTRYLLKIYTRNIFHVKSHDGVMVLENLLDRAVMPPVNKSRVLLPFTERNLDDSLLLFLVIKPASLSGVFVIITHCHVSNTVC